MTRFLFRRLAILIPTLIFVSMIIFGLQQLLPGDPAIAMAGEERDPQAIAELRAKYNLDKPIWVQYGLWIGGILQGDFGESIRIQLPVSQLLLEKLPVTIELAIMAMIVALAIGIPTGIISAVKKGTAVDYTANVIALSGLSIPNFWLGIMLILLFPVTLHVLPPSGRLDIDTGLRPVTGLATIDSLLQGNWIALRSALWHLALPAVTLGTAIAATLARVLRSGLLDVKGQDYIEALRARGLSARRVIRHMLRNAMPATVTVMGVRVGTLLGGAIVVETVFSWPGVGRLIVDSIQARDYPVVQGAVLMLATMFAMVNLATDLIHGWLDPRIKHGRATT